MRLIDADALLSQYEGNILTAQIDYAQGCRDIIDDIKAAPTVEPIGKWNPIKTRPLNDEEIELWAEQHGCEYEEGDGYMCLPPLPREGEEVLICDASGNIDFYTYHFASQFELGMYDEEDEDRPVAWMPLPKPWRK